MKVRSRRQFATVALSMASVALAGWPTQVRAASLPKIGILFAGMAARSSALRAFYDRLGELGDVPDRTVQILLRAANGDYARLPQLARELVAWRAEVIVGASTPAVIAAMQATHTTPIVMVAVGDPAGDKIVANFAHPEANVTGPTLLNTALTWKEMEALHELLPHAQHAAVLWNPANPHNERLLFELQAAASSLGIQVHPIAARSPEELTAALRTVSAMRPDALVVLPDPLSKSLRHQIIDHANNTGLPSFFTDVEDVASGALLAYGVNMHHHYQRAADYVHRILNGARPGDLPVQQPTQYELSINAATARRLGIRIPVLLRVRADRIYE